MTVCNAPRLTHALGALGPMPQTVPQLFQRAAELALGVSLNAQSQVPDIPGALSRTTFLRYTSSLQTHSKTPDIYSLRSYTEELLVSLNAQAQAPDDSSQTFYLRTFICCRSARIWKSSWILLTTKTKILMIFTPRIDSMCHVFSSKIFTIADQNLQDYPRRRTSHTFPFNKCHKTVHRNSLIAYCHCPIRVVRGSSFIVLSRDSSC